MKGQFMNIRNEFSISPSGLLALVLLILSFFHLIACAPMSETRQDLTAGLNGGFEVFQDGLPVNWQVYSPKTVPDAEFSLRPDTIEKREGRQSIRFDVDHCRSLGGRLSPGLATELPVTPGEMITVSFWMKQTGVLSIRSGAVSAHEGRVSEKIRQKGSSNQWARYTVTDSIPEPFTTYRFELSVLEPGTVYFDDFRMEQPQPSLSK